MKEKRVHFYDLVKEDNLEEFIRNKGNFCNYFNEILNCGSYRMLSYSINRYHDDPVMLKVIVEHLFYKVRIGPLNFDILIKMIPLINPNFVNYSYMLSKFSRKKVRGREKDFIKLCKFCLVFTKNQEEINVIMDQLRRYNEHTR